MIRSIDDSRGNAARRRVSAIPSMAALACLMACTAENPAGTGVVVLDSAGVQIVVSPSALADRPLEPAVPGVPDVDIGVVEGDAAYQLFGVTSALPLEGGRLVLVNSGTQELRFFDTDGRFLKSVGGRGEGPGEYQLPFLLPSFSDTLFVYDRQARRYTLLDREGTLLGTVSVNAYIGQPQGVLENGRVLATANTASAGPETTEGMMANGVVAKLLDLDGTSPDTLGVFEGPDLYVWKQENRIGFLQVPFDVSATTATGRDRIWITPGRFAEIREHDGTGRLVRILRVDRELDPTTRQKFDAYVDARVEAIEDPAFAADMRRWYGNMSLREAMPAWSRLVADMDGNVLAERFREDGATPATWTVFGRDGVAAGSITLPAGARLLGAGRGWLIALQRDELDVEHVILFPYAAPGL